MEAHGGYLCRLDSFGAVDVAGLARECLREDGLDPTDAGLQVSTFARRRVFRFAYDCPRVYGRQGARWYQTHHALARSLSSVFGRTVHAYVYDPEELELVVAYGDGRRVGGELLRYEDAEADGLEGHLSDREFRRLQERWPLGHLARVLGLDRKQLLALPRCPSVLLDLEAQHREPALELLFAEEVSRVAPGPSRR